MKGVLFFDGACLPVNPGGVSSYGYVIYREGKKEFEGSGVETENGTNNIGEYAGLIYGLEKALRLGIYEVEVYGDSQLVIFQLTGRYGVNSERIRPYYRKAKELLSNFKRVALEWVPREKNSEADKLSALAYIRHELEKEWEKKETIRDVKVLGEGKYEVNGHRVEVISEERFFCECPAFKRKNSYSLVKKAGMNVPCKHVAYVLLGGVR